ncbi:MAG TPA: V-type ATP synthase subunit D [Vicinamibacterales bacterium]|jgi:V/A-type H+-transporting ATPase subunit D
MSRLNLTRMSLLQERSRLMTARRGIEILHSKRDALLRELRGAAREALEFRRRVSDLGWHATAALVRGLGLDGQGTLRTCGLVTRRDVRAEVRIRNLWGVRIPSIEAQPIVRHAVDRGYGIVATSTTVDEVAEAHERLLTFILREAPKEIRVRRLAAELRRTSRKVNTLEHSVIPRLRDNVHRISMALDEQERQERHRLQMLEQGDL